MVAELGGEVEAAGELDEVQVAVAVEMPDRRGVGAADTEVLRESVTEVFAGHDHVAQGLNGAIRHVDAARLIET